MQAWVTAVIGRINSTDLAGVMGAVPAVYLDSAAESTVLPLVVITKGQSVVEHDLAMNQYIRAQADVTVYASQLSAAEAGARAISGALDGANFAVQGAELISNRVAASPAGAVTVLNSEGVPIYKVGLRVAAILFVVN
jgi:hypothetical protein